MKHSTGIQESSTSVLVFSTVEHSTKKQEINTKYFCGTQQEDKLHFHLTIFLCEAAKGKRFYTCVNTILCGTPQVKQGCYNCVTIYVEHSKDKQGCYTCVVKQGCYICLTNFLCGTQQSETQV